MEQAQGCERELVTSFLLAFKVDPSDLMTTSLHRVTVTFLLFLRNPDSFRMVTDYLCLSKNGSMIRLVDIDNLLEIENPTKCAQMKELLDDLTICCRSTAFDDNSKVDEDTGGQRYDVHFRLVGQNGWHVLRSDESSKPVAWLDKHISQGLLTITFYLFNSCLTLSTGFHR